MVSPGNANRKGMQAPPPPGQSSQPTKAAEAWQQGPEGAYQGKPRPASATMHSTEVLNQRRKVPVCPAKLAVAGFAAVAVLGYLTLYSKKKPEATALDVAKVATGTATPENTHPRK